MERPLPQYMLLSSSIDTVERDASQRDSAVVDNESLIWFAAFFSECHLPRPVVFRWLQPQRFEKLFHGIRLDGLVPKVPFGKFAPGFAECSEVLIHEK